MPQKPAAQQQGKIKEWFLKTSKFTTNNHIFNRNNLFLNYSSYPNEVKLPVAQSDFKKWVKCIKHLKWLSNQILKVKKCFIPKACLKQL